MEIEIKKKEIVNAKTLRIHTKIRDRFSASLVDGDENEIVCQTDGYVPDLMPGEHFGDYLLMDIDIETGKITNWEKPSAESLQKWIDEIDEWEN